MKEKTTTRKWAKSGNRQLTKEIAVKLANKYKHLTSPINKETH